MACLSYNPSKVQFENAEYARNTLIQAKIDLINFSLDKLSHLDLANIYQKNFADELELQIKQYDVDH
jgi:hypothetical protein